MSITQVILNWSLAILQVIKRRCQASIIRVCLAMGFWQYEGKDRKEVKQGEKRWQRERKGGRQG